MREIALDLLTEEQMLDWIMTVRPYLKQWGDACEAVEHSQSQHLSPDEQAAALNPWTNESDPRFCLLCRQLCDWRKFDWYFIDNPQHVCHFRCVRCGES